MIDRQPAPPSPVDVARHLLAASLGYFSRRGHVGGSARVACIQMEAAVGQVSVTGESIRAGDAPELLKNKSEIDSVVLGGRRSREAGT